MGPNPWLLNPLACVRWTGLFLLTASLLGIGNSGRCRADEPKPVVRTQTDSTPRNDTHKPRIINTTDLGADPDDEQSLVRLFVCANEFDIEGLVVSTSCWKKSQSDTKMLDKIVDAYGKAFPNLRVHAEGYPTVEHLRSIYCVGARRLWHGRRR